MAILIESAMDDLDDAWEAAAVLKRIRVGEEQTYSLADVITELGLDPSDL